MYLQHELFTIYNMSGRVVSDIQAQAEGEVYNTSLIIHDEKLKRN